MQDSRTVPRNRTFLPARIEIDELGLQVNCTIRDISERGARLQLSDSVTLPPSFRLYIPKFDRTVTVEQRWRRGDFIGVHFDAVAAQAPAPSPEERDHLYSHKLEAEIARLKLLLASIREDPSQARALLDRDAA